MPRYYGKMTETQFRNKIETYVFPTLGKGMDPSKESEWVQGSMIKS